MNINQEQLIELYKELPTSNIPFSNLFTVSEFKRPEWEETAFLVTLKKDVYIELQAFIMLIERLEYVQEEWDWNEPVVEENRPYVLRRIVEYLIDSQKYEKVDAITIIEKVNSLNLHVEFTGQVTKNSSNLIVYNDWNFFQVFGYNQENYYLITWYTTA